MKSIAIVQSNYIPWKGYFDLIASANELIIYDDMQYTRRDWRNRNKIKTPRGLQWLTVPVISKGKYFQTIRDTQISSMDWARSHWKSIELNYGRSKYFREVSQLIQPLYVDHIYTHISELNKAFIVEICNYLDINTLIRSSSDFTLVEGKTERLANLCIQVGGHEYISGPAAKDYINPTIFADMGIKLSWFNYDSYPVYPQLWGDFNHGVSILDLLFNCGRDSALYMKHVR